MRILQGRFAEARARFAGQQPLIEIRKDDEPLLHRETIAGHVVHWYDRNHASHSGHIAAVFAPIVDDAGDGLRREVGSVGKHHECVRDPVGERGEAAPQ